MWAYWSKKKQGGLSYLPFVDSFPSCSIIHSLKLENTNYSGALIRVRNRTTLVESDIFPQPNGFINESDLTSKITGSEVLEVITFYDQVGSNHLLLTTSTGGIIADSFGVFKDINLISVSIQADNIYEFSHSGMLNNNSPKSLFSVFRGSIFPNDTRALKTGTRGNTQTGWLFRFNANSLIYANVGGSSLSSSLSFTANNRYLLSFTNSSTFGRIYNKNILLNSASVPNFGKNRNIYTYGDDAGTGGHVQAFHLHALFDSDQNLNALSIQNLLIDFYEIT